MHLNAGASSVKGRGWHCTSATVSTTLIRHGYPRDVLLGLRRPLENHPEIASSSFTRPCAILSIRLSSFSSFFLFSPASPSTAADAYSSPTPVIKTWRHCQRAVGQDRLKILHKLPAVGFACSPRSIPRRLRIVPTNDGTPLMETYKWLLALFRRFPDAARDTPRRGGGRLHTMLLRGCATRQPRHAAQISEISARATKFIIGSLVLSIANTSDQLERTNDPRDALATGSIYRSAGESAASSLSRGCLWWLNVVECRGCWMTFSEWQVFCIEVCN